MTVSVTSCSQQYYCESRSGCLRPAEYLVMSDQPLIVSYACAHHIEDVEASVIQAVEAVQQQQRKLTRQL